MAIATVVAGAYGTTYNAVSVGMTVDGFRLSVTSKAEQIDKTDTYGDTLLDLVYRGGTHYLDFTCRIYAAGATTPFWPWGSALGTISTTAAPIGRLGTAVAASTVMTATANTPAAATPATLTATKSILAPDYNAELLYDSRARTVPVRLALLPSETAGTATVFTMT